MMSWCIVCPQKNKKECEDFIHTMRVVCNEVNIKVADPQKCYMMDDSIQSYNNELRRVINPNLSIVVVILSSLRQDKYNSIKK